MQQVQLGTMKHARRTCDEAKVVVHSPPHAGRAVAAQQRCQALLRDGREESIQDRVFLSRHRGCLRGIVGHPSSGGRGTDHLTVTV